MYCGDIRSIPLDTGAPSFPPCAKSTLIWPSLVGSGKFDTPCERMQSTYVRAALYFAAVLPPLPVVWDGDVWVVVVVEPRFATPDDGDPPQAAPTRPPAARARMNTVCLSGRRAVICFSCTSATGGRCRRARAVAVAGRGANRVPTHRAALHRNVARWSRAADPPRRRVNLLATD